MAIDQPRAVDPAAADRIRWATPKPDAGDAGRCSKDRTGQTRSARSDRAASALVTAWSWSRQGGQVALEEGLRRMREDQDFASASSGRRTPTTGATRPT